MREMVICSGLVNRFGYRILPAGIVLDAYLKNPVLLAQHEGEIISIGKVNNLHLNTEGKLVGTPEFDKKDPLARLYKRKYKKGYLNACSLGGEPLATSTDPKLILEGQTKATVIKLELYEISMTNIPGDRDAVGSPIELSAKYPEIKLNNIPNKKLNMDYKNIAAKLGLPESATEVEIVNAIETIQLSLTNLQTDRVESLITLGKTNGAVTDENEASMRNIAKLSYIDAAKLIGTAKEVEKEKTEATTELSVEALLKAVTGGNTQEETGETFIELSKTPEGEAKLKEYQISKPDYYSRLSAAYDKPVPLEATN